ncbi:hypothetical protein AW938_23700 [Pseudomonas aeruginosa]|nr:hypothetical protein G039_0327445 [Pseudomonas aeruginosa VRFPA01]KRU53874.1 hypothetical protein AN450_10690 [Pseudomonas aeruginosa]KXF19694.1 hypothetical protein AW938_23700 [Pseudomonas aeruginosa]KXF22599.1 hypothetical protein AW937_22950 [Pseudomonas aeruginosa]KXF29619.1 hypothetical protein AW939_23075 [Pseudomonas aeruginosa]
MAIAFQIDAQTSGGRGALRCQHGEWERLPRQYLQLPPMRIRQLLQRLARRLAPGEKGAKQYREGSKKTGPPAWAGKVEVHQKS